MRKGSDESDGDTMGAEKIIDDGQHPNIGHQHVYVLSDVISVPQSAREEDRFSVFSQETPPRNHPSWPVHHECQLWCNINNLLCAIHVVILDDVVVGGIC